MHTDFSPRPSFRDYISVPSLPWTSIYNEMVKFYHNLSTKEAEVIRADSFSAIHHILRFMAAEWMNVGHIIDCELTKLDYMQENIVLGSPSLQQMKVLHMWRRRCARYRELLRRCEELCCFRGPILWPKLGECDFTILLVKDFQAVHDRFKQMEMKAEKQINTVLAKISIEAGEQSIDEVRRVTRLSIIATIFLPLSLVASVFSMNGRFSIDGDNWWMYMAIAIPLTSFITLCGLGFKRVARRNPAWSVHHDHFDTEHLRGAGLSY